jgi:uncharacterized protein (DUF3820 family)
MRSMNGKVKSPSRVFDAQNYTLTFGPYSGKTLSKIPICYLRSLEHNDEILKSQTDLREAFALCLSQGCFRFEVENYSFNFGEYKNKHVRDLPEAYFSALANDAALLGNNVVMQQARRCINLELGNSNAMLECRVFKYHCAKRAQLSSTLSVPENTS